MLPTPRARSALDWGQPSAYMVVERHRPQEGAGVHLVSSGKIG
jgi:hypothetical protein